MEPYFVINNIDSNTTVVQFSKLCFRRPTYEEVKSLSNELSQVRKLILDLSDTEQMTTAWLKQFLLLVDEADTLGKEIELKGVREYLRKNMAMTGLTELLDKII